MKISFCAAICLPMALSVALRAQVPELTTTVAPLRDENILNACEYRMAPPESTGQIRAVWVIFDRGQDYLQWYRDRQVRAFASQHRLALVLAMQCRSKEREDMIVLPEKGVGRAMFTALDQFAIAAHKPELGTASVIAMGWSGAGSLVARLAAYRPARYLAGIAYAPGQYDPLGMDTISLSRDDRQKPQLIIANGADNVNGTERPYRYFRKNFDEGAPWTFVIQNRTPHCCLQNAQSLILDWLDAVLQTPYSELDKRQYGYLTVDFSGTSDEWKRPVFNSRSARVGNKASQTAAELPAGWLPSDAFAANWLLFVNRSEPLAVWKP